MQIMSIYDGIRRSSSLKRIVLGIVGSLLIIGILLAIILPVSLIKVSQLVLTPETTTASIIVTTTKNLTPTSTPSSTTVTAPNNEASSSTAVTLMTDVFNQTSSTSASATTASTTSASATSASATSASANTNDRINGMEEKIKDTNV